MWRRHFGFGLLAVVSSTAILYGKPMRSLTEQDAVAVAEKFVVENGYTDLSGNVNKVVFESIERSNDKAKILEFRRNTLQRKAYGVSCGTEACFVVFRYIKAENSGEDETGRAVTMDADGSNIRMQHKDFFLRAVKRKL